MTTESPDAHPEDTLSRTDVDRLLQASIEKVLWHLRCSSFERGRDERATLEWELKKLISSVREMDLDDSDVAWVDSIEGLHVAARQKLPDYARLAAPQREAYIQQYEARVVRAARAINPIRPLPKRDLVVFSHYWLQLR